MFDFQKIKHKILSSKPCYYIRWFSKQFINVELCVPLCKLSFVLVYESYLSFQMFFTGWICVYL